jgi:hypothetical protein
VRIGVPAASLNEGWRARWTISLCLSIDRRQPRPTPRRNGIRSPSHDSNFAVEAANAPITPLADDLLAVRGVQVLPDILVNAGGVTVSYFEWVQNIENGEWDLDEINRRLQNRLYRASDAVVGHWQTLRREAAGPMKCLPMTGSDLI